MRWPVCRFSRCLGYFRSTVFVEVGLDDSHFEEHEAAPGRSVVPSAGSVVNLLEAVGDERVLEDVLG